MSVSLGSPVYISLEDEKVKGRVCKIYATGYCCVYLGEDIGCLKFLKSTLEPAEEPAPSCTLECSNGC